MKNYKVISEKFLFGDKSFTEGQSFTANPNSANVKAGIRFKQVKEVKSEAENNSAADGPQSYDELKEALKELGVEFKGNASKVELEELYAEATAE